jgi:fumarate reductase flavoprotein subunit
MPTEITDLVVIGAGAAGLACSILAAQNGARVRLVEKTDEIGGTLHVAGGKLSAGGTRRQKERGIEDSPDAHFDDVMRLSNGTADPVVVRLAVDEAPHTVDWLDDLGFPFDPTVPAPVSGYQPYRPYSAPRLYWGPGPVNMPWMARTVLETIRPLFEEQVAAGKIDLRLGHRVTRIIREDGVVVGVEADGPDGPAEFRAASTVITTGGYGNSPELFARLTPGAPRLVSQARESSTGDGLLLVEAIGGVIRNGEKHLPGGGAIETVEGSGRAIDGYARLTPIGRPPREIHVNAEGRRFRPEDDSDMDTFERLLIKQTGHLMWMVFDEKALVADDQMVNRRWDLEETRARAAKGEHLFMADTLRELALKAGIDPDGLQAEVVEWNNIVDNGIDPLGRKELNYKVATGPFYALKCHATPISSAAGITVDGELRVTDADGEPIPGLYAAGEALGAGATMGNAKVGGMMVTPALSLGRVLGRKLAIAAAEGNTVSSK